MSAASSSASLFLERMRALGVEVLVDDGGLVLRPANRFPADLIPEVRRLKPELLTLLAEPDWRRAGSHPQPGPRTSAAAALRRARASRVPDLPQALRDAWHERVSIATVDGEQNEQDAQRLAADQMWMHLAEACLAPAPPTKPHGCLYGRHFVRAPEEPSWRCEWCHPVLGEDHVRHTIPKQHASAPPATPPPEAAPAPDPPPPTTPCRMCGSRVFHHRPGAARWICQSCHPRMSDTEQVLFELPAQEVADG